MSTIMRLVNYLILIIFYLNSVNTQCVTFHNTIYKLSGTNCGQRCVDKNVKRLACISSYTPGCYCKPGYFRDSTWNCILGQECDLRLAKSQEIITTTTTIEPELCPPNELFSDCGNYCSEMCRNINSEYCPQNICDVGCFCIDGYFRSDAGVCVPQPKCGIAYEEKNYTITQICPFGEHYEKCGQRCTEQCRSATLIKQKCKNEKCTPGCFCDNGFVRNIEGNCIPEKKCKLSDICGKNEEFSLCGNPCIHLCNPPAECLNKCEPGCFCKAGFFRNSRRQCVNDKNVSKSVMGRSATQFIMSTSYRCEASTATLSVNLRSAISQKGSALSKKCGSNEVFNKCGNRCGQTCDSLNKDIVCPMRKICVAGCYCQKGFYRNQLNKCVSKEMCKNVQNLLDQVRKRMKKLCHPKTEEYKDCGNHCEELCHPPSVCPSDCGIGCFCRRGLFRSKNGDCILGKSCPQLPKSRSEVKPSNCKKDEKWYECNTDCIQTCAHLIEKNQCPKRKRCQQGCLCMKGYYRNEKGQCVREELCHKINARSFKSKVKIRFAVPNCPENEEYLMCGSYCIELCKPLRNCTRYCQPGCFCKKHYLRNEKGNCVMKSECNRKIIYERVKLRIKDKCTKENEIMKCGNLCGNRCVDKSRFIICPNNLPCTVACFCKPGFYRNRNNDCVSIKKCSPPVGEFKPPKKKLSNKPKIKCGKNEVYDDCGDSCTDLCKPPDSCDPECVAGCFCELGFYRTEPRSPCIPEEQCLKDDQTDKQVKKIKMECEPNEIYSQCGTRCGQMCRDLFKTVICPKKGLCVGGCFCVAGYFRNEKGKCVPESQCPDTRTSFKKPLQCDANEKFKDCGDRCKQSCEYFIKKVTCSSSEKCSSGCFCNDGFYKDQYGNCVDPKYCTDTTVPDIKPIKCGKHEKFESCGKRCDLTCEELVLNRTCSNMRSCARGCFCKKGYLRSNDGNCIPKDDCFKQPDDKIVLDIKCGNNEEYSKCEVRCGQACEDLGRHIPCPKTRQCASGCFCKDGYFRNEHGDCVKEADCPDVGPPDQMPKKLECGPNEVYNECGTRCGQACDDLSRKVACPTRRICISGCFCAEGFFTNYSGDCVPILECPEISPPKRPAPTCDANEEFNYCGRRCGQSCDDFTFKKFCPKKQLCISGCFCDSEHRRDFNGDCVPTDTCPARDRYEIDPNSIKCGKNEEYTECGSRCGQGCEDLLAGSISCPNSQICISGCFCKPGFYRNGIGNCIPKNRCPSRPPNTDEENCGENERYTVCGSNCGTTCDFNDKPMICPRKRMCLTGCFCKLGFFRNKYNKCVPESQCKVDEGNTQTDEEKSQPKVEVEKGPVNGQQNEELTTVIENPDSETENAIISVEGSDEDISTKSSEEDNTTETSTEE